MMENKAGNYVITLCAGPDCLHKGADRIKERLDIELARHGLLERVRVALSGCLGLCDEGPLVIVNPGFSILGRVTPEDVPEIIERHILHDEPLSRLAVHADHLFNRFYRVFGDVNFFGKQMRIALRNCGIADPESLDDYLSLRGYEALAKALTAMTPQEVVAEVKKSGLRGRGGAGFPTGMKWEFTAKEPGPFKYVICNADEGDPGAFMDRSAIEGDPHTVLEGMAIAGYAVGAQKGFIYIRAEYPLAISRLEKAIAAAKSENLLGDHILGSDFSFDIEIRLGAGAFVCGEETALIHSIEGQRGNPTPRPPYPAAEGVFKKPTVINNVETWANVPVIILDGADWFSSIGTKTSKGTKVFALAGNVRNSGLIEVPMGTTLREIVYDVGGGIPNNKDFKGVQTGGPSGGCLPERYLDTQVDYESLAAAGSIMGSGGMIVIDENTCMVNMAKFFLEFTQDESCGKCTPCREGIGRLHEILTRITKGQGQLSDLDQLETLGQLIRNTSLCGLGQSAPNPALSALRYFREEFEEHILKKKCRAGVCRDLTGAPCQSACPLGTEAWRYVAHVAQEDYEAAYLALREPNPLPAVLGRVCNHPCERSCRAGRGDGEAISIRDLKRFVTDRVDPTIYKPVRSVREGAEKIAVVGAGPGGLSAAHYLSLKGYRVTLFDAESEAGGVLMSGIPAYRLPRDVLRREIGLLMDANITFQGNTVFGRDITVESLKAEGYRAVFLAIGSHQSQRLGIEGETAEGVHYSMAFLKGFNLRGEQVARGRVGVIGGGNSAPDAARTALRQAGVESVKIFYRRTRREMPAFAEEIEAALDEGVELETLIAPKRIIIENGRLKGVEFIRNKLGPVDDSGRPRPIPIEGSEHIVPLDTLIVAISEKPDADAVKAGGLEMTPWGTIQTNPETMQTSIPWVFAGGDAVSGPNTVVWAVADGKKSATMIDRYVNGISLVQPPVVRLPEIFVPQVVVEEGFEAQRPVAPTIPVAERRYNFKEIEKALGVETACNEARRCLRCDLEFTQPKA